MIRYLKHSQIDKSRWDDCIGSSVNRRVYAFSWYLDIVNPGWEALAEEDYSAVFPLPCRRKRGISYLAQPYFTQQLGLFSPDPAGEEQVAQFLHSIPRHFRLTEIRLNAMNPVTANSEWITARLDHELDLARTYGEVAASYSQNVKRNLRKAEESEISVRPGPDPDTLIRLFRETYGQREGKLKDRHYAVLRKLISYCLDRNLGLILGAFTPDGSLCAGAFFLDDADRSYYLLAASAPVARENGAMFLLIDRFIADSAGKKRVLDFEGGNDPDLGRFYKSFGAAGIIYPEYRLNRLPLLADQGLKLLQKFRK